MTTAMLTFDQPTFVLQDQLEYPKSGILSKILFQDQACQYTLFCLGASTAISEHTSTRNALLQVLAGTGKFSLQKQQMTLEPGVIIFIPAHAPHALQATENLAFLLMLSAIK